MKRFILLVALLGTLAPALHAIDFTPRYAETFADGYYITRLYFDDGPRRIYYRPPKSWQVSGDVVGATFLPGQLQAASVRLQNSPALLAALPLDKEGIEMLRLLAREQLPRQIRDVAVAWETVNPVTLQDWTSYEVGFTYKQFDKLSYCSVLFLNLDAKRQVRFVVDAAAEDFQKLYNTTHRTLATWWETAGSGS